MPSTLVAIEGSELIITGLFVKNAETAGAC
jgi:hypothetical protein